MRAAARRITGRPPRQAGRASPQSRTLLPSPPGPGQQPRGRAARFLTAARDPFRVALLTLVILDVSRVHQQIAFLKVMRPALVMTGIALLLAFLRPGSLSRRPLLETWPAKGITAFFVLACCSMLFGISFGSSALFILNVYAKTVVFAFLIILSIRSARDLYAVVCAFVISTGWLAYTSMFVFHLQQYGNYSRLANLDTYDANDVGLVLLVGLALTLLVFQTAKPLGKAACGVLLVGIGASLAKTGSRGAFVGLLGLGAALLVLADRVSIAKRLSFVAVMVLAMVIFAPPGYWDQMKTIQDPKADYNWSSVNGRKAVAERGIGYMLAYPLFGVGISNFPKAECSISDKAKNHVLGEGIRCTPPHNAYIEAGAETGVPGLLLWIAMVPGGVVWLMRLRRRIPKRWANGDGEERFLYLATMYLAVMLVGYSIGSFFLSFTWYEVSYYIFAVLAGLSVAVADKQRRSMPPAPPNAIVAGYGR